MGVKVAKFGGSSVADGIQIRKTKEIIDADQDRCYIVVSAPGKRFDGDNKITDLLYLCKTHKDQNVPYDQVFQVIYDRFIAMELDLDVNVNLVAQFEEIKNAIEHGATEDYIASRGECLNAMVIAAYLGFDFVDTKDILLFDDKGNFLSEESNKNLKTELKKHKKAVLPGFYGSLKKDGSIKTFSRGGSDITGAIVAKAMDAEVYENWTDVSGFLMADPRIVKDAKPIEYVSYMELRELSYMGASVLHESAISPAREENIPINIRNTNRPQDPGTIITAEPLKKNGFLVTGIAGTKDFVVIAIYKNNLSTEVGFIRKLLTVLEDYNIPLEHLPSGIDTVSMVIAKRYVEHNLDEIIEEMRTQTKADSIEVYENMALIATVGARMASKPGVAANLFNALFEAKVNIRMIDQGSSEMNIIVGVKNKDFNTAIRAIYNAFVE
jgi:aspartate kinase